MERYRAKYVSLGEEGTGAETRTEINTRTLARKIEQVLRAHSGECWCDDCLARELPGEEHSAIARAAAQLGTGSDPQMSRYRARCDACGRSAMVARASPNLVWA